METITEDYCSRETYRLLIEKGFKGEIHTTFDEEGYTQQVITHQLAMKWLRDVHNKFVQISAALQDQPFGLHYRPSIQDYEAYARHDNFSEYVTYKDACEAAIKYCLENLI